MTQNNVERVIILYLYAIFPYIYTRGETTSGAKRLVGAKRLGGKRLGGNVWGAKRLEEEMVWGRNVPDSQGSRI